MLWPLRTCLIRCVMFAATGLLGGALGHAQSAPTIPRARNLALVQALHIGDTLDRESVVTLVEASSAGVKYRWNYLEVRPNGDTTRGAHDRFVSSADLDTSTRFYELYEPNGPL